MASFRGWRLAVFGLAAAICTMSFLASSQAYSDPGGSTTASPFDNVIVISLADYQLPAFDVLPVVKEDRVTSYPPSFRPKAIKERASRFAVRPTSVSGWRSGRVRTLAA